MTGDAGNPALSARIGRRTLAAGLLRAGLLRAGLLRAGLLRAGAGSVFVAGVLGHVRLDTTRGYTLPVHAGLEDAVGRLPADR
ncbi:hypothetical protein [Streptomyces sp. NPDC096132]|uniref:hypothetical protein n=1 Tax=Streptomyces sp. NPDC096132 TaxID=3366075 RepID=UPI0037F63D9D